MSDPRTYFEGQGTRHNHDADGNVLGEGEDVFIRVVAPFRLPNGNVVSFSAPSAVALSLDLAIRAAENANSLRDSLETTETEDRSLGRISNIGPDSVVYDCLQQSMLAVSFSYQALEVFCNEQIGMHEDEIVKVTIRDKNGKRKEAKRAKDCERSASTESKLTEILPQIMDKKPPKGLDVWTRVKQLQTDRNAVIHMKNATSRPRASEPGKLPKATVFSKFLTTDAMWMPQAAIDMLKHFEVRDQWFDAMVRRLG